jgi:prepilin-type processing-associated H-X9-DG protein
VVQDPAGTILLVEEPNGQGIAGNIWPCISLGVSSTGSSSALYQMDPSAGPQNPFLMSPMNQGIWTYQIHGGRFSYLFHDGHVASLTTNQTIGAGTLSSPKGMWTVVAGD